MQRQPHLHLPDDASTPLEQFAEVYKHMQPLMPESSVTGLRATHAVAKQHSCMPAKFSTVSRHADSLRIPQMKQTDSLPARQAQTTFSLLNQLADAAEECIDWPTQHSPASFFKTGSEHKACQREYLKYKSPLPQSQISLNRTPTQLAPACATPACWHPAAWPLELGAGNQNKSNVGRGMHAMRIRHAVSDVLFLVRFHCLVSGVC